MLCKVGRNRDENHATCRSCIRQSADVCRSAKKAKPSDGIRVWHEGLTLMTTAYLESCNHWHGRPRGVYLGERKKWEHVFRGAVFLWGAQGEQRRVVAVRRFVASPRQLIRDTDNLHGAMKPLKDSLVRAGVLRDDADEFVTYSVTQEVDPERARVEVDVFDCKSCPA